MQNGNAFAALNPIAPASVDRMMDLILPLTLS